MTGIKKAVSGPAARCLLGSVVVTLGVVMAAGSGVASAATGNGSAKSTGDSFAYQAAQAAKAKPAGCSKVEKGKFHCYLSMLKVPAQYTSVEKVKKCKVVPSHGWSACNIENMYGLKAASAADGTGQTVAVIDAYDDPNAESDLDFYRSTEGLPACTTSNGCFEKVNQDGQQSNYPSGDMGWGGEISLDLDMVSAICPNCHIILVEANSSGFGDLLTALDEGITLGATEVTDSWGTGEFDGETGYDSYLDYPGIPITFSSGDGAYQAGVQYPSASPDVISVGGTMLVSNTKKARGWNEKAWSTKPASGQPITQGSGSGCSSYEAKPAWQSDPDCSTRMTADVSAVAASVLEYDTYESGGGGWYFSYGTSDSTPIIAAVYALAANASSVTSPASIPYAHTSDFYDITKGSDGTCTPLYFCNAEPGYDGPTGIGTPDGIGGF